MEGDGANGHPAHVYFPCDFNILAAIPARCRWPQLILVSLDHVKSVLMIRGLTLLVAPLFGAAAVAAYAQPFAAAAFVVAGLLILLGAALCVRDGAVLASKVGHVTERRKQPVLFWFGVTRMCAYPAGIVLLLSRDPCCIAQDLTMRWSTTSARSMFTFSMTTFLSPCVMLALGGRSSACSR